MEKKGECVDVDLSCLRLLNELWWGGGGRQQDWAGSPADKSITFILQWQSEESFQTQILFTQMEGKLGEHSYVCICSLDFYRQKRVRNMVLSPSVKCPQSFAGTPEPVCHSWSPQMSVRQGDINVQTWLKGRWTKFHTYNTLVEHWWF